MDCAYIEGRLRGRMSRQQGDRAGEVIVSLSREGRHRCIFGADERIIIITTIQASEKIRVRRYPIETNTSERGKQRASETIIIYKQRMAADTSNNPTARISRVTSPSRSFPPPVSLWHTERGKPTDLWQCQVHIPGMAAFYEILSCPDCAASTGVQERCRIVRSSLSGRNL